MKVRAGSLTDEQRELIFKANREADVLIVAAMEAHVLDTRGPSGSRGPDQFVGVPQSWDYETLTIGSVAGSFSVTMPWEAIRGVWLRDDAPPSRVVVEEFLVSRESE